MNLKITREFVRRILIDANLYEWSIQGLGMLRCYLGKDRVVRLHVWDSRFKVENVSQIHDHPWDFESYIISGMVVNTKYKPTTSGKRYKHTKIICGPGGCSLSKPDLAFLALEDVHKYAEGESYSQKYNELHETFARDGTITIITREKSRNDDTANIYWEHGDWVSAEPRPATVEEVLKITRNALERMIP